MKYIKLGLRTYEAAKLSFVDFKTLQPGITESEYEKLTGKKVKKVEKKKVEKPEIKK